MSPRYRAIASRGATLLKLHYPIILFLLLNRLHYYTVLVPIPRDAIARELGQVDYIIRIGEKIYPIKVKSGSQGAMQSLRVFINEKKLTKGIRTSLENFCSND